MKVLGLDLAFKKHGICVLDNNEILHIDVLKINSENEMFVIDKTVNTIFSIAAEFEVQMIVIEGLALQAKGSSMAQQCGLHYCVRREVSKEYELKVVAPSQLKKQATGKGNADKQTMFDALPTNVKQSILARGYKKTTGMYDAADAYWLARYQSLCM